MVFGVVNRGAARMHSAQLGSEFSLARAARTSASSVEQCEQVDFWLRLALRAPGGDTSRANLPPLPGLEDVIGAGSTGLHPWQEDCRPFWGLKTRRQATNYLGHAPHADLASCQMIIPLWNCETRLVEAAVEPRDEHGAQSRDRVES